METLHESSLRFAAAFVAHGHSCSYNRIPKQDCYTKEILHNATTFIRGRKIETKDRAATATNPTLAPQTYHTYLQCRRIAYGEYV